MAKFRFQDLEIWKLAIEIADRLFDIADVLEKKRLYRFAEQLRGAGMSAPNNIAEGSGSNSDKDFENANILILLSMRNLISEDTIKDLLEELDHLSRKITAFRKTLKK